MFSIRLLACAVVVVSLLPTATFAAGCSASTAGTKFTSVNQVPRGLRTRSTPPGVSRELARIGGNRGTSASLWDEMDLICDDWIAVCTDEKCDHGVIECDGVCVPF